MLAAPVSPEHLILLPSECWNFPFESQSGQNQQNSTSMSNWYPDRILNPDLDSTDRQGSTLSTLLSVPLHPGEQGSAQKHEDIDLSLSFEYIVVGKYAP